MRRGLIGFLVGMSAIASAQTPDVDQLLREGVELRKQRRDEMALDLFRRAYGLSHGARAQAQMALAEQALGRWVDADADLSQALTREDDPWITGHRDTLSGALDAIRQHVGDLEVAGNVAGAEVLLNKRPLGHLPLGRVRVVSGTAVLEVKAPRHVSVVRTVVIPAGSVAREVVELAPEPESRALSGLGAAEVARSKPLYTRWWVWVTTAAVVAGVAVAIAVPLAARPSHRFDGSLGSEKVN